MMHMCRSGNLGKTLFHFRIMSSFLSTPVPDKARSTMYTLHGHSKYGSMREYVCVLGKIFWVRDRLVTSPD